MASKETLIVFVYDTQRLRNEADDPVSAVLYFHPAWVSDTQKVALCGQLMGASYFLKDCFFKPRLIALQNGKFVLKEFGRFILAVGTDRNINDSALQQRADLLSSLLKFFHGDLQSLHEQCAQSASANNLSERLYHIFETYLPLLQNKANILQHVSKLRIPKTGSNIFLDAMQTLQCCQKTKGILGGAIFYHNKVVATQLSDSTTKRLVLTDPLHVRTTAEQLNQQDFHVPNGVQLLLVYVERTEYRQLLADAQRAQNLQTTHLGAGALPFQYAKRKLKRDKSLIFTHIPEEASSVSGDSLDAVLLSSTGPGAARPKSLRPTHLPLRLKCMSSKELPESGIASINFDETDSYPEFIGRTSVCSTPLAENKVLPVAKIMSICAGADEHKNEACDDGKTNNNEAAGSSASSTKLDFERFFQNFISNPNKDLSRRKSFADLQESLKKMTRKFSLKHLKTDINRNESEPDFIDNDENSSDESSSADQTKKATSHTITDPTYPVFNANGQPISRSLFQEFLDKYKRLWGDAKEQAKQDTEIAALVEEFREFDAELQKLDDFMRAGGGGQADRNLNIASAKTPLEKRSMSLPLKPLSEAGSTMELRKRQPTGGVPLTPLMAKLSVLAMNESTTTPVIEVQTPLNSSRGLPRRSSLKCDEAVDAFAALSQDQPQPFSQAVETEDKHAELQSAELYMCGQQNMTLALLMERGCAKQESIVRKLFEICVAKFPHMEAQLSQMLNVSVEGEKRGESDYSFMCIDASWDAIERNGAWNPMELATLEGMQSDMHETNADITDLIIRAHDTVYYGYKSGRTEIFYKEPAHQVHGIPPPSDPQGSIASRARLRLERDHNFMLF